MVKVIIKKPLYGTFVNIRKKYLDEAILKGEPLVVEIPQGVGYHDPRNWIKTGKKVKQVFKFADSPMVLYGNHVAIPKETEEEKNKKLHQLGIFG